MLSKVVRANFWNSIKGLSTTQQYSFAKQSVPSKKSKPVAEEPTHHQETHVPPQRSTSGRRNLKDIAHLSYKTYPNVTHNDPSSPEYIHSERDEYHDSVRVNVYNKIVDGVKNDIKMQEEVYKIIEHLDRPYKHGIPGNTKNITGGVKDYFPQGNLGFKTIEEDHDSNVLNKYYTNVDRWTNQTVFYPKFSPIQSYLDWQKEYNNRPVTSHFHHDKGYKYDVETSWDQRHPHVADRFGYPEILGTPFERLMRLEGEIFHPTYLDQPFVQVPSSDPHPGLNFEEGEVVYENTNILEWSRFWNLSGFVLYAFGALFIPYNYLYKTHMPTSTAYDNMFIPYHQHTMFYFDNLGLHIPTIGGIAAYATYLSIAMAHRFWKDYVVKMQFSKDKELLFVTRISPFGSLEEEVYETHHLEVLPPSVKTGVKDLSSQDKDGLWDITCLASHKNLVVYNEDKYWNPSIRKEFFDKVMNFWTPDLISPSRSEELNRLANAPKIVLGGSGHEQIEGK